MAKSEWGLKRTCLGCGARFYDLNNDPIICPKCGATFDPEASAKLKRSRNMPAESVKESGKQDLLEVENEETLESGDEDVLEDTSDLDGDDVVVAVPTDEGNEDI